MAAIRAGATPQEVFDATKIDPWFVDQLFLVKEIADEIAAADKLDPEILADAKRHGFSDAQIAAIRGLREDVVREVRHSSGSARSTRRSTPAPPSSPRRRRTSTRPTTRRPRSPRARSRL